MPTVDAITYVVDDMAVSLNFYRLLGFDIPASADASGYVTFDQEGVRRIAWSTKAFERLAEPDSACLSSAGGSVALSVRCGQPAAVDDLFRTIVEAGHASVVAPMDAPWGARHCRVLDPDGNPVDLFAPLP
jgi:predicted lactoylglutathione lyase